MSRNVFQNKEGLQRRVNVFPYVMRVVEPLHSETLRDPISQPAVVALTSGLHLKSALLCQRAPPPHPERMLTDVYINMMMLFVQNNVQNFQSDVEA